jgi:chromate transport protein ChrA
MALQSTFFRTYATPLKVNGAFLAAIVLCFIILILSFKGHDRYGWLYPLLSALGASIAAIITNIILAIIMSGKDQRSMAIAYSIAVVSYLLVFLFFWSIAGQMRVGKLEGG